MHTEVIKYQADGLDMVGHLYFDERGKGKRPGVLVYPHARGLGDHDKSVAERLAKLGYVALACDLHGNGQELATLAETFERLQPLRDSPTKVPARAKAAFDALLRRPEVDPEKIAAIGYCIGGAMALELARTGENIAAVVAFHGRLVSTLPDSAKKKIKGKVLACLGADDPHVSVKQRLAFEEEMRATKTDCQINVYSGVVHGFTTKGIENFGDPKENHYNAQADARSWSEMLALFKEVFG